MLHYFSLVYQNTVFSEVYIESLVNKCVNELNEVTVLKFIGVFLGFGRGVGCGVFRIKPCISKINTLSKWLLNSSS